jgi:hypothetical protein
MRWAGLVARMWRRGMHIGFWLESQNERYHQGDIDVAARIILKCILGRFV